MLPIATNILKKRPEKERVLYLEACPVFNGNEATTSRKHNIDALSQTMGASLMHQGVQTSTAESV